MFTYVCFEMITRACERWCHTASVRYGGKLPREEMVTRQSPEVQVQNDTEVASQSGGYDVEWFVETPDHDLICTICQGVLRCPVRATCHHIFCKKCILRWLKRQETCPCCRKPINACKIYVMFKLSKSIGHLKIKCKNEIRGCAVTFPLSEQYCHKMSCVYELILCPYQGCHAQLLRGDLDAHSRRCEHWREPCHMGCGTILSQGTRGQHNCYMELKQRYKSRHKDYSLMAVALQRKMRRMQKTMTHVKEQIELICGSLQASEDANEAEADLVEASSSSAESSSGDGTS
ncbi:RING finger protein 151 isoform X2 [Nerophis ophidion]|uniref:RING finger protein 151 isoform X2 n=1 Tax=Nerophis ophidion TaxID=159077 RepID=UPI002AE04EE9|nr:RING finger protein 151 isoform X2 [Nerophis ophidion]